MNGKASVTTEEVKFYSVVVPINSAGEILMGLRIEDGIWTNPAGGSEAGETPEECVIREAWEEARLEIVPNQLEFLYEGTTPDGAPVWCYLFRCGQGYTTPEFDPDDEVREWLWIHPTNFPKEFDNSKHKERRMTIVEALHKFHYLGKSEELLEARDKFNEGGKTSLLTYIQSLKEEHPRLSDALYRKLYPHAEQAQDTVLGKSVVPMGQHTDGGDIETANVALDRAHTNLTWLFKLYKGMKGFKHGDIPVEFDLMMGKLFLTKVEDGLYSGSFKYSETVGNPETGQTQLMEDTARVSIHKLTLPTIVQFLMAKHWIDPFNNEGEGDISTPSEVPSLPEKSEAAETNLTEKVQILTLINKILNNGGTS